MILPLILMSCGKSSDTGSDARDSKISRAPQNPELLLRFVNNWSTTEDVLKYSVNLTLTQSQNIFNHKKGNDGIYGTIDDDNFESIQELDDIPYVGQSAIDAIDGYAINNWESSDTTAPTDYHYALKYLDNKTLRYWKLEKVLNLDNDVVENIYDFRCGPDSDINTADDTYFETINRLDSVPEIGAATLEDILTKCRSRKIQGAENIYSASISWPRDHRLTTFTFDINALLSLEKNITRQNALSSSSFVLTFYDTEFFDIDLEWNSIADTIWEADYDADTGSNSFHGYIYWISDTQAKFNGYISGNPVEHFPETLKDTFTQQWNFRLRLGNNPFAIYDTIGDDEFLKMRIGDGAFPRTHWEYFKYGDFPLEIDSDNDGLSDSYEQSIGTDSYCFDTDGDSINDYNETAIFLTKPDDSDSDKDGIPDYVEIYGTNGYITNPLFYDTDGDSVYDGYEVQYNYNPLIIDSNYNGIPDGLEDFDIDGYVNWIEADNNTDPTTPDSPADGPDFIMYVAEIVYGPGGGGDEEGGSMLAPIKRILSRAPAGGLNIGSLGYGGRVTLSVRNNINPAILFKMRAYDITTVEEPFSTDINEPHHIISGSLGSSISIEFLTVATSNLKMKFKDNKTQPKVHSPYKGTDLKTTNTSSINVIITDLTRLPMYNSAVPNSQDAIILLSASLYGAALDVELSTVSGNGSAAYTDNSTSKSITTTTTLSVKGVQNSSIKDNIKIAAKFENKILKEEFFTVSTWPTGLYFTEKLRNLRYGITLNVFFNSESGNRMDLGNVKIRENITYSQITNPPFLPPMPNLSGQNEVYPIDLNDCPYGNEDIKDQHYINYLFISSPPAVGNYFVNQFFEYWDEVLYPPSSFQNGFWMTIPEYYTISKYVFLGADSNWYFSTQYNQGSTNLFECIEPIN